MQIKRTPDAAPAAQQRDAEVAAIYRLHLGSVRRRALRITGSRELAEDVAHEVFVKFLGYYREYQVDNVAALLQRMATQTAVLRLRRSTRLPLSGEAREAADPERRIIEDQLALAKVIAVVDGREAQIAVLYYLDGRSQHEIAAELQMTRRAVGRELEHFCERARRLLGIALPLRHEASLAGPSPLLAEATVPDAPAPAPAAEAQALGVAAPPRR